MQRKGRRRYGLISVVLRYALSIGFLVFFEVLPIALSTLSRVGMGWLGWGL